MTATRQSTEKASKTNVAAKPGRASCAHTDATASEKGGKWVASCACGAAAARKKRIPTSKVGLYLHRANGTEGTAGGKQAAKAYAEHIAAAKARAAARKATPKASKSTKGKARKGGKKTAKAPAGDAESEALDQLADKLVERILARMG